GRGLEAEVWIAAFDGSAAHQVTADQRAEGGLAWSTRNVIAFASSERDDVDSGESATAWAEWCAASEVRLWDEAGGLRTVADGCAPAWAPDGLRLALATRPAPMASGHGGEPGEPQGNAIRLVNWRGENAWDAVQLRRDLPPGLDPQRPGLFLHRPVWTPDGRAVIYTRLVGYAALCDNSTVERTDAQQGGVTLLGWVPDRVKDAAVSADGRYLALDLARCNAPGFGGYNTVGLDLLDLSQGSTVSGGPILGDSLDAQVPVAATPVLRERRLHSPAWSPTGAVLAHLAPPDWPGAEQLTPDPSTPYNSTAPAELRVRDLATGQNARLAERVDFGSPLAWAPTGG
ncbi:MAG: hypothetical protein ACRDJN_06645, partial [Chloroflexota bacterium]